MSETAIRELSRSQALDAVAYIRAAESRFHEVSDPELIVATCHELSAAEARFVRSLREARVEAGLPVGQEVVLPWLSPGNEKEGSHGEKHEVGSGARAR